MKKWLLVVMSLSIVSGLIASAEQPELSAADLKQFGEAPQGSIKVSGPKVTIGGALTDLRTASKQAARDAIDNIAASVAAKKAAVNQVIADEANKPETEDEAEAAAWRKAQSAKLEAAQKAFNDEVAKLAAGLKALPKEFKRDIYDPINGWMKDAKQTVKDNYNTAKKQMSTWWTNFVASAKKAGRVAIGSVTSAYKGGLKKISGTSTAKGGTQVEVVEGSAEGSEL